MLKRGKKFKMKSSSENQPDKLSSRARNIDKQKSSSYANVNGQINMGLEGDNDTRTPGYLQVQNLPNGVEKRASLALEEEVDLGDGEDYQMDKDKLFLLDSQISTTRDILDQEEFDKYYHAGNRPKTSPKEYCSSLRDSCECSGRCIKKKITNLFPFIKVLKNYSIKEDLVGDVVSGLTIGIMQIPQGMAYAMLAAIPPQYGLYTSLFPVLIYFLLGTSRHVSVGTFAVVSLMVGSSVEKFDCGGTGEDTTAAPGWGENTTDMWMNTTSAPSGDSKEVELCKVGIATAVTFLGGMIQLLLGLCRMGFVTMYLSEAMTRGFTTGCAIHVFSSQIKYIFGVEVGRYSGPWKLIYTYRDLFLEMKHTNFAALILSVICMVILYVTKEYLNPPVKKKIKAPIPIDLIVVIFGTLASALVDFNSKYEMQIVGDIPMGFPAPSFPPINRFADVFVDSIAVAIVAFAISVSMVQLFARKHNYETDSNQELIAHGVCNGVSANFNCYMMCVSLSRSVVQENIGCKSQLSFLVSSGLITIVILFIAAYFEALPNCVLAAIIIVALKGMFMQFKDLPKYWKISGTDLSTWLVTFVAVVLLDVGLGLVVGVVYSLLTVVGRTQRPYSCTEGKLPGTDVYKDIGVYPTAQEIDGIKIFRFDGAVYFANNTYFVEQCFEKTGCDAKRLKLQRAKIKNKMKKQEKKTKAASTEMEKQGASRTEVLKAMEESPQFVLPEPNIHHVILDCTTMSYLDAMGVIALKQLCTEYKDLNVTTFLAGCKAGVREMLEAGGFHEKFDKDILYPGVHDAVVEALSDHPEQKQEIQLILPSELNTRI